MEPKLSDFRISIAHGGDVLNLPVRIENISDEAFTIPLPRELEPVKPDGLIELQECGENELCLDIPGRPVSDGIDISNEIFAEHVVGKFEVARKSPENLHAYYQQGTIVVRLVTMDGELKLDLLMSISEARSLKNEIAEHVEIARRVHRKRSKSLA